MHTFWLVMLKPLIISIFMFFVFIIAKAFERLIPNGRLKRSLYKRR